jgi:hypothetical protein
MRSVLPNNKSGSKEIGLDAVGFFLKRRQIGVERLSSS